MTERFGSIDPLSTQQPTKRSASLLQRTGGVLAVGAILSPLVACNTAADEEEEFTLSLSDWIPPSYPFSADGAEHFMESVEEKSEGAITFDHYPTEQLGSAADLPDLLESGATDITSIGPAYVPSDYPLTSVSNLPGLGGESCHVSAAIMELLSPGGGLYEREFEPKGLRPLFVGISTRYEVFTRDRQVSMPEDLQGLQLRSGGGAQDRAVRELGAAPVAMTASEMYEAIQRGTVDGTAVNAISVLPYNLQEVVDYGTIGAPMGNFTAIYTMRNDVFEELPEDLQEIVLESAAKANQNVCEAIEQQNEEANEILLEEGTELYELTDDELAEWLERVEPAVTQWVEDLDGADILDEYEAALEAHE